jgi:hypothetical protein
MGKQAHQAKSQEISHLLQVVPYEAVPHAAVELPRRRRRNYKRPPIDSHNWVPTRSVVK